MQRNLMLLTMGIFLIPAGSAFSQMQTAPASPDAVQPATQPAAPLTPAPRKSHPKKETQKLVQELSLTPDQETKVAPIIADRDQQIAAVNSDTSATPTEQKKKIRMIRKDYAAKIEAILTDAQKQTFDTARSSRAAGKKATGAGPATAPPPPAPQM